MEKELIRISKVFTKSFPGETITRVQLSRAILYRLDTLEEELKRYYIPNYNMRFISMGIDKVKVKLDYDFHIPHWVTLMAHHIGLAFNIRYYCDAEILYNNRPTPTLVAIGNKYDCLLANQILTFYVTHFAKTDFTDTRNQITASTEFKDLIARLKGTRDLLSNELTEVLYQKINHYIENQVKLRYALKGGPHVVRGAKHEGLHNALARNYTYSYKKLLN